MQSRVRHGKKTHESAESPCPSWDSLGLNSDLPPFFSPNEALKRAGFQVKFLSDHPRKESPSAFQPDKPELWFEVEYDGQVMTWTISQISLLLELKKHAPLGNKIFHIQLVPVDEAFKNRRPKYKGKDRYVVAVVNDG